MDTEEITIFADSPFSQDAIDLMNELSDCLQSITGGSGRNSFHPNDVCSSRSLFVIAKNKSGNAIGCGAFRPVDEITAEIKRVYAKQKGLGIGSRILSFLEQKAISMGYRRLLVETRLINKQAVSFYEHKGYNKIPNYGNYENRPDAVCFEKILISNY